MRKALLLFLFIFCSHFYAQDITNTLPSGGMFYIRDATKPYFTLNQSTGKVGIGPNLTNPRSQLEIGGSDGLLVTGTYNSGTLAQFGAGTRMHYYPRRDAFRVGVAETNYWDDDGSTNPKLAAHSIGMGYQVRATGVASVAIGPYNKATNDYALALGAYSQASGSHSIAIGTQVYASGIYSIALGSGADTNGRDGSFVFGDDTYFQTAYSSADNQITMRFSGGYRFWTSYPDSVSGVYMRHGQSGWSNYCDRNKKENFEHVDGEWLLAKIKKIPISKWNYKKTDPNEKYIGPMAQDFYAAFQLGGTDSLGINSISIDGVNMAGVQALEKRTSEMKVQIEKLTKQNEILIAENKNLKEKLSLVDKVEEALLEIKILKKDLEKQLKVASSKNEEKSTNVSYNSPKN